MTMVNGSGVSLPRITRTVTIRVKLTHDSVNREVGCDSRFA